MNSSKKKLPSVIGVRRILVVGAPGAGKSCFSKKLSAKISYPLYHLDDYYWLKKWECINPSDWLEKLESLCKQPSWIIDGNHLKSFNKRALYADMVIMLDYSPLLCLWRFCKRSIKRYFKINDHLPKNILEDSTYEPKLSIQWHLIKLILFYRIIAKSIIINHSKNIGCKYIIFKKKKDSDLFLKKISSQNFKGF